MSLLAPNRPPFCMILVADGIRTCGTISLACTSHDRERFAIIYNADTREIVSARQSMGLRVLGFICRHVSVST